MSTASADGDGALGVPYDEIQPPDEFDPSTDLGEAADVARIIRVPRPWHRPRKQYVRRHQWAKSLTQLIDEEEVTDELTYLGLPGDEFLDIRFLADGPVATAGTTLRFLGFNDGLADDAEASGDTASTSASQLSMLEETRNHPNVNSDSRVQPDDIRRVASELSPAYHATRAAGPFDVINFDLTQSMFAKPMGSNTYTLALRHLLGIQVGAKRDWLLWVTMRVDRNSVHLDEGLSLLGHLRRRFDECQYVLDEWLPEHFDAASPGDVDLQNCSDRDFAAVLFIGFCTWLSDLATNTGQKMRLTSCLGYSVLGEKGGHMDMLSLVVRFSPEPVVPDDFSGVTEPAPPNQPDRCEKLATVMERHRRIDDLDARLAEDAALRARLIKETADLLASIGMDRDQYLSWVAEFPS